MRLRTQPRNEQYFTHVTNVIRVGACSPRSSGETAREVVSCDTEEEARAVTDAMMGFLQRLGPLHLDE